MHGEEMNNMNQDHNCNMIKHDLKKKMKKSAQISLCNMVLKGGGVNLVKQSPLLVLPAAAQLLGS